MCYQAANSLQVWVEVRKKKKKKKNRDLLWKQKDDMDSKDYPYTPGMVTVQAELYLEGCGGTEQSLYDPRGYFLELIVHVYGLGHESAGCPVSS